MLLIRSVAFNVLFYLNLLVQIVAALPTLVMPRWGILAVAKFWARTNLWLLHAICGIKVEFRGQQPEIGTRPELGDRKDAPARHHQRRQGRHDLHQQIEIEQDVESDRPNEEHEQTLSQRRPIKLGRIGFSARRDFAPVLAWSHDRARKVCNFSGSRFSWPRSRCG